MHIVVASNYLNPIFTYHIKPIIMNTKKKSNLWDILVGLITALIAFFLLENLKLNIALIAFSPFPVIAGFIRGKIPAENIFIKTTLMNLLFFVLIMPIMNGVFHLALLLAIAFIGTTLGIYTRLNWPGSTIKVVGFLALFFVSILSIGFFALPAYLDVIKWDKVNHVDAEFSLVTLDGDTIHSSAYENKVIIMSFWATWCVPCKKQFPLIEKLYKENKDNTDVSFFVVHSQIGRDTYEKAMKYINQSEYDLPFVHDLDGVTYKSLDVNALPYLIIIGKDGSIRYTHTGYDESENFYEQITHNLDILLNENKSRSALQ